MGGRRRTLERLSECDQAREREIIIANRQNENDRARKRCNNSQKTKPEKETRSERAGKTKATHCSQLFL